MARGTGRCDGECGRHPDRRGAGRRRHSSRASSRSQNSLRQCGGPLSFTAKHRASARSLRSRLRLAFHQDKPVIFNFHGYPWLIHKFTYRRTNHDNIHVRGYKEKGNIIRRSSSRFATRSIASTSRLMSSDRVPRMQARGAHLKEWLKAQIIESINYAYAEGIDKPEFVIGNGHLQFILDSCDPIRRRSPHVRFRRL